jgi:hypothetical protein
VTELDDAQFEEVKDCTEREIKEAIAQLDAAGYPIGWRRQSKSGTAQNAGPPAASQTEGQSAASQAEDYWQLSIGPLRGQPDQTWPGAILGILLTGLAVSLGSSFWFDLLGKFMNVRMTGKREDTVTPPERSSAGEASRTNSRPS